MVIDHPRHVVHPKNLFLDFPLVRKTMLYDRLYLNDALLFLSYFGQRERVTSHP